MFDDSPLLIRHIRSCFIQGDESGQCEQALDETAGHCHSPAIALPDSDDLKDGFGDRFSTNKTGTTTKVFYLTALENLSMKDFYSEKKQHEEPVAEGEHTVEQNNLSNILASHFANPFHKYSRFSAKLQDGSSSHIAICPGVRTLNISIFLTSKAPIEDGPMTVYVNVTNARIVDLIGLILWQYIAEKQEPPLPDLEIANYALLSADDGEVDFGIPSFDPLEPLSKYGFSTMALVYVPLVFAKDKTGKSSTVSPRSARLLPINLTVTLSHYNFGTHEFLVESKDVTLAKLLEMYIEKVGEDPIFSRYAKMLDKSHFALEADAHPGRLYDNLETTIGRIGCVNFKVHRRYCNPIGDEKIDFGKSSTDSKAPGQIFRVAVQREKGKPVEVDLVVDVELLFFNQREPNTSKSIPKSIVRATIESCRLVGADVGSAPGSKQVVRVQLTYIEKQNTTRKVILEISEQITAVELISLLRK